MLYYYKSGFFPKCTKMFLLYESQCMPAKRDGLSISLFIFTLMSKIRFHELRQGTLCSQSCYVCASFLCATVLTSHEITDTKITVSFISQWRHQEYFCNLQWTLDLAGMSQLNDINWCEQEEWKEEQVLTCVLYIIYAENKITEATREMERGKKLEIWILK